MRTAAPVTYLFSHAVLVVAVGQIKANSVGKIQVDLVDETMSFPEFA